MQYATHPRGVFFFTKKPKNEFGFLRPHVRQRSLDILLYQVFQHHRTGFPSQGLRPFSSDVLTRSDEDRESVDGAPSDEMNALALSNARGLELRHGDALRRAICHLSQPLQCGTKDGRDVLPRKRSGRGDVVPRVRARLGILAAQYAREEEPVQLD
jgi:hypothetical protein